MLALEPRVVEAVWQAVAPRLPKRPELDHPLGCHRPRVEERKCFVGVLTRLVTGCSWDVAAGVFDGLVDEALASYDRIVGLELSDVAVDGSLHKAPLGGEGTGPNPTDRGKSGWKWSVCCDRNGVPLGWAIDGANRNDCKMLADTLDTVAERGLLAEVETLHLDRGYDDDFVRSECAERHLDDVVIARRRVPGRGRRKKVLSLGMRWPVERTNSWLSNFGQLRRNTDRFNAHRLSQFCLAVVLIITVKLFKRADRWNP